MPQPVTEAREASSMREIERLVLEGKSEEIAKLFYGMPARERSRHEKELMKIDFPYTREVFLGRDAAILSCGSRPLFRKLKPGSHLSPELFVSILADRALPWIDEWVQELTAGGPDWYPQVRAAVKHKLCAHPRTPGYVSGVILAHASLDESDVEDIWMLFEIQGARCRTLPDLDRNSDSHEKGWIKLFRDFSESGALPRDRLLDQALGAVVAAPDAPHADWFAKLFEELRPTPSESQSRAPAFYQILLSKFPRAAEFGVREVTKLIEQGSTISADQAGCIVQSFRPKPATLAARTLKLLESVLESNDSLRAFLLAGLNERLSEIPKDHLKKARGLLKRFGGPTSVPASSKETAGDIEVDPILVERARKVCETSAGRAARIGELLAALDGAGSILARDLGVANMRKIRPDTVINPCTNVHDLVELGLTLLESNDQIEDEIRFLYALARLRDVRVEGFDTLVHPLLARARSKTRSTIREIRGKEGEPPVDVSNLELSSKEYQPLILAIYAWLAPETRNEIASHLGNEPPEPFARLVKRFYNLLLHSIAASPRQLLSEPTHRGGWIDPLVLARRVVNDAEGGGSHTPFDQILALHRIAFENRENAREVLGRGSQGFASVLDFALGGEPPNADPLPPAVRTAAERARVPFDPGVFDLVTIADSSGGAGDSRSVIEVRFESERMRKPSSDLIPETLLSRQRLKSDGYQGGALEHRDLGMDYSLMLEQIRLPAQLLPQNLEPYFAVACESMGGNLHRETCWANRAFLEPLNDPEEPLRPLALSTLLIGLNSRSAPEAILALDIIINSISDGRLAAENLGSQLLALGRIGVLYLSRWAVKFRECANVSLLHALVVRNALQQLLTLDGTIKTTELLPVLELLTELSTELGGIDLSVTDRDTVERIAGQGKSKTANQARALLEVQSDPTTRARALRAAAAYALAERCAIVEAREQVQ